MSYAAAAQQEAQMQTDRHARRQHQRLVSCLSLWLQSWLPNEERRAVAAEGLLVAHGFRPDKFGIWEAPSYMPPDALDEDYGFEPQTWYEEADCLAAVATKKAANTNYPSKGSV